MTNDVFYPGPVHVAYSPFDPFDIGEPRTFAEDNVTFLTVPSWGEMDRLATIERAAREVAEAWHDYEEAHAGRHGGPHEPERLLDGDCGVCASAQYGTEVTMNEYVVPALRASLEAER